MIASSAGFVIATPTKCGTTTLEAMARRAERWAGKPVPEFAIMDWDRPRRQHRMALPPTGSLGEGPLTMGGWGDADRYLLVRNPFRRYISVYEYLKAPQNYSQWGAREVQGWSWGGHDESKIVQRPPLSFSQFLRWLADARDTYHWMRLEQGPKNRGDLTTGFAYRSPWVWTDSLVDSLMLLRQQPGKGGKKKRLHLMRLENLDRELALLRAQWNLSEGLPLDVMWANRGVATKGGKLPEDYWRGVGCVDKVYKGKVFRPAKVPVLSAGCGECPACAVDVGTEAAALGYA